MQLYPVEVFVVGWRHGGRTARRGPGWPAPPRSMPGGREGAVCFVDWVLVPDDEICFYFFTAGSRADVACVSEHAGLGHDRIVAAL